MVVFLGAGGGGWGALRKANGGIAISISKPNGLVTCRWASAPKTDKKTNLKPTDKDNPKRIRRLGRLVGLFGPRYVFNPVLRVALHGRISGGGRL